MTNTISLISRKHCHLCEQAEDLVAVYFPGCPVWDVDVDESRKRLYGVRVPVLLKDGEVVMEGAFTEADIARLALSIKSLNECRDDSGHK